MIIKPPACYDTSHYKIVPDFALVSPRPLLVITKATESLSYMDDTFVKYFTDLKQESIHRGCYHFFRKAADATKQAQHFCNTIRSHITDKDLLILDVEEGGETAAQLKAWLDVVRGQFPRNQLMIYSRKNILDAIPMTTAQKDYFKDIPVWTAGYPFNPDLYSSPPVSYIPDQTKYGEVWLWQYTEDGVVFGISGGVDCSWMSPILVALLGGSPEPNPDTITEPHPGMKRISGTRYARKFELFISDPTKVRFESVCLSPLETVSSVVKRKGATTGFNGGEWDRVSRTKDYTVSNGAVCRARVEAVPSLMILKTGVVFIDHMNADPDVQQALSGLRYLIRDGVIQAYLSGAEPQYTEGHARSIHGINSAGHHMCLTSEGVYPNQGLTLKQAAELMKQYGATIAFDSGGGGDAEVVLDGVLLTLTENINPVTGLHFERPLPNVLLVYAGDNPMPEEDDYYLYSSPTDDHAIRTGPDVTKPYISGTYSKWIHGTPAKGLTTVTEVYTFTQDLIYNGAIVGKTGDVWRRLYDNNGHAVSGWIADIHMGKVTLSKTLVPTNPEPTGKPARIDMTLSAGSVVTVKDSNGNTLWTGTA